MEGTNIGKASSRTYNSKRSSRFSPEKEEAGRLFSGVLLLLLFGVKIVEYGFAVVGFVSYYSLPLSCTSSSDKLIGILLSRKQMGTN